MADADPDKPTLSERLTRLFLKADSSRPIEEDGPVTVEELEEATARITDKERLIGLLAAPIAGMIGWLVSASLVANDPSAKLASGAVNPAHVNPTLYSELGLLALGLAIAMLAAAWFRKRLYLGIIMALYGLSIFNLHFWGFGVPYVLAGAWYLVRAYRLQGKLKLARADGITSRPPSGAPARPSKRYTPPTLGSPKTRRTPKLPETGTGS